MSRGERTWNRWHGLLASALLMVALTGSPAATEMRLLPGAAADLDQATVDEVLATFRHAEQALHVGDVDGIMALYSEHYNYHGLKKGDMRQVWINLLDEFRELSDAHHFSRMIKVGSGSNTIIEVTCTGSLSGLSKTGGLRVPIDSWYEEVHYMTFEQGQWRIRGNVGDSPRFMPFGTSPHPLF